MGDPFLRAYYSIYDVENNKIGLVGIGSTVYRSQSSISDLLSYVLIGAAACIGTALICCLCQYVILKRR